MRRSIRTLVIAAMLGGLSAHAGAQPATIQEAPVMADNMTIRLQTYPGAIINLMQWVMVEKEICTRHEMKCELLNIPSAPLGIQALVAGDLDIVVSSADGVVKAAIGGAPIQFVGGLLPAPPFALSMRSDVEGVDRAGDYPGNIKSVEGMKIGVTARGAGPENQMRLLLADAGLNPDNGVIYVAVGSPSAQYAALAAKQIDGVMGFEPLPTICEDSTLCYNLVDLRKGQGSEVGRGGSAVTYVASTRFTEKNPKLLDAFRQASAEAIEWSSKPENFPEVMAIAKKYFKLGDLPDAEAVTERLVRNQVNGYHWVLPRDGIEAYYTFLAKEKADVPAFDTMIYSKAY
ncbi:ABC transporter substrate-binding protein [Oceanibacterium hippocampi]|uniref:NMT1/THI5 like protein n=1 Tax=Oceanibacterium hippocampi TaxID=745714 RepID=A0A1Y5TL07_9PROT|nr:ABC transporter substrate-binding protein [Oceanibacterium hippocampi]SLN66543.1 NMT1/THI5 like protein [Oceanibacterium hippocampi]